MLVNDVTDDQLPRTVGLWSACGLVVGVIVGSGIFSSPSLILWYAGTPAAALLIWLVTGLLAMAGALTYVELGTLIGQSGGEQVYLREIYGDLWSFQFVWFSALVGKPASMAIVLTVIAEYWLLLALTASQWSLVPSAIRSVLTKALAIGLLAALMILQIFWPKAGERLQNSTSGLKLILLLVIAICGAVVALGRVIAGTGATNDGVVDSTGETSPAYYDGNGLQALILACYQGLWAYDGWNNLNIITGELVEPERSLPRAILISMPLITALYLVVNAAYLTVLPLSLFRRSLTVAIDFARLFFGNLLGSVMAGQVVGMVFGLLVTVGTIGSCSVGLFIAGRLMYAAARKKQIPFAAYFTQLDSVSLMAANRHQQADEEIVNTQVPIRGLLCQASLMTLFLLTGTYQSLIQLYSWMIWVFYGMSALGVILLRNREPYRSRPRPFKVPIALTYMFFITSCLLVIVPLVIQPMDVLGGLVMFLAGIPFYFVIVKGMSVMEMWRFIRERLVRFRQSHAYQPMSNPQAENPIAPTVNNDRPANHLSASNTIVEMKVIHAIGSSGSSDSESEYIM